MIDLNPIRNRIAYHQITLHQLTAALDASEEATGSALRKHLAQGIVREARALKAAKEDLVEAEAINDRADTDTDYQLTDKDYY